MPMLSVYVDDETFRLLAAYSERSGRAIDELASAAVSEEVRRAMPPPRFAPLPGACNFCKQKPCACAVAYSDHR